MTTSRSPWCFRPDPWFVEKVEAFMKENEVGKTEAIHTLVKRGLSERSEPVKDRWAV